MRLKNIVELNNELQAEGKELLKELDILNKLSRLGKLDIGGSFVYGTMVDRDIDIAILTSQLTIKDRARVMDLVSAISQVSRISMVDYVNYPRDDRGVTIWIGLTIPYRKEVWNIDLTLADPKSPDVHTNMLLHKSMLKIDDKRRYKILKIKYRSLKSGTKVKGQTSSETYKKVLNIKG
ncbi:MAG: hypothetical protein QG623_627 [Patescibacteria group bacterium]|nr:hypothetical protein [Patescibacteria group bacterium]